MEIAPGLRLWELILGIFAGFGVLVSPLAIFMVINPCINLKKKNRKAMPFYILTLSCILIGTIIMFYEFYLSGLPGHQSEEAVGGLASLGLSSLIGLIFYSIARKIEKQSQPPIISK